MVDSERNNACKYFLLFTVFAAFFSLPRTPCLQTVVNTIFFNQLFKSYLITLIISISSKYICSREK